MNAIFFFAAPAVAGIILLQSMRKQRNLARKAASAQLDAMRFCRHMERLEMVLKEVEPALLGQVRARSDMEWQQAIKGLEEGQLPALYPLETKFTPIVSGASRE